MMVCNATTVKFDNMQALFPNSCNISPMRQIGEMSHRTKRVKSKLLQPPVTQKRRSRTGRWKISLLLLQG